MQANDVVDFLREFPDLIEQALMPLNSEQVRWRPGPDEWSVLETACHVRDAFEIEGMRIRALLTEPGVTLPAFDGMDYVQHRLYRFDEPARVVAAIAELCEELTLLMAEIDEQEWGHAGVHEEAGPVTVGSRASWIVEHGQDHLQQITAVREQLPGV
jgi:hypothetical protein